MTMGLVINGEMMWDKQSLTPQPLSEERGEWLAVKMEEVILGLIRGGDNINN